MLDYLKLDTSEVTPVKEFTDFNKLSVEARDAVMTLAGLQIVSGKANGQFDPHVPLTRSQMAKILYLSLEQGDMLN